jgi:sulfide:quinone oxidoreductase
MPHRVLIAGSGVAAVEAVLALRHIAGRGFEIELLAPSHVLEHRPASVATPFGLAAPPPLDLHDLARRYAVTLVTGELASVEVDSQTAHLASGETRPYDHLIVAVGAVTEPALAGSLMFTGPADVPMVEWVLGEVGRGHRRQVVVVVPRATTWSLPAYELAIMARSTLRASPEASVTLVTSEREPLWIFGDVAGAAMRDLLAERDIELYTGTAGAHLTDDVLWLESGDTLMADTVLSLPRLRGPAVSGLPQDERGFIPTDAHGYVMGADRVLAAGDATTFPIKQGGLATQQADAAAATIAQELGAAVEPRPFVPVLRGLLLTGGAPLYLRAELDARGQRRTGQARRLRGEVSSRALWWPPGKVAGRYLAPYLSTARPVSLGSEPLVDRSAGRVSADEAERDAALDLALLLAEEDEAAGDLRQALHALDAAAALGGGVLPAAFAERRERWLAQLQGVIATLTLGVHDRGREPHQPSLASGPGALSAGTTVPRGTTSTGQDALRTSSWDVPPSISVRIGPCPREPQTRRSRSAEAAASLSATGPDSFTPPAERPEGSASIPRSMVCRAASSMPCRASSSSRPVKLPATSVPSGSPTVSTRTFACAAPASMLAVASAVRPSGVSVKAAPITVGPSAASVMENPVGAMATGHGAPSSNRSVTALGRTRPTAPRRDDPSTSTLASLQWAKECSALATELGASTTMLVTDTPIRAPFTFCATRSAALRASRARASE